MDLIQSIEAIERTEMRHQDQLRQAELDQLASSLHQRSAPSNHTSFGQVAHPMRLAGVIMLLMAVLAVAAV
jgi:hypothetical protein